MQVRTTTSTPIICSWFESRYPSTNRRRIPRRNHLSPTLSDSPETGRITVNYTENPLGGCLGVVVPGPIRACHGPVGLLTSSLAHLLRMDTTTQITPTFLTQRELAELLRMPERTLEDWRLLQTGPPYLKLGRLVRYDVQDVLTWVHENRHG